MGGQPIAGILLKLRSQEITPGDQGLDKVLAIGRLEVTTVWKS